MTPDVNILLAHSRSDHPHHLVALEWVTDALANAERGGAIAILPMVAAGFLRVATNSRIFRNPLPVPDALAYLRGVLRAPGARMATLGPEWPRLARLCEEHGVAGGDVTDAWIAAAIIDQHEHLVTFDRGFRRYRPALDLTIMTA